MRKTLTTVALVLTLCCPVFAGEMNAPPATQPPPPAPAVQEPTTDGIIQNDASDGDMDNGAAAATFAQVLLNLLALS